MQYFTQLDLYQNEEKTAVTLGKFDGLHCGHWKLIEKIREHAAEEKLKSIVFSFDMGREALMTAEEKKEHLEGMVDTLIVCPFTQEIREMEAEVFIKEVLAEQLHAAYIAVGTDFRFGHEKKGDIRMLSHYAPVYGYRLEIVEKADYHGREISSTYIREALDAGNVSLAEKLLGYRYRTCGIVEHGQKLGRTLGFPTLNVVWEKNKVAPRYGVYACIVRMNSGIYQGIANIGVKPTVTDKKRLLTEVYVYDYEGDAYGQYVEIEFCEFERPETTFHSVQELKKQVDKDMEFGRIYFREK